MKENTLQDLLASDSVSAAKGLIGWRLYKIEEDGAKTGGVIIETEAYSQKDAASHSFKGQTPRTEVMFGPAGRLYVYFTYGMHWCMNIVTGPKGHGQAVLIRAIEIDSRKDLIINRRGKRPDAELTNGPAKLCQALGVTGVDNGQILGGGKFELLPPKESSLYKIIATKRIGISKDTHRLWRFVSV